ncbi:hypothetical protein JMJ55_02025 [Belnapia sp. T6]|uniref:Flagellar assembly regulator FliX n=1 Tax=Belnapia mucosa TaxID=2804532 RepID=A0ABS1UX92_9PROT|nr:flagellar assembly protein FliX [Belnapia mucosa]MBL6454081.1 hypothetical protein [Belnapia mucosa]
MQGIGGISGPTRPGAPRRGGRSATGFAIAPGEAEAGRDVGSVGLVAAPGSSLLALQETGSDASRNEAAQRQAREILAELTTLQCDMLSGSAGDVNRLGELLESVPEAADPGLREAIEGVRLRAQVEMLRRSRVLPENLA